jgi:hypothetical protein
MTRGQRSASNHRHNVAAVLLRCHLLLGGAFLLSSIGG